MAFNLTPLPVPASIDLETATVLRQVARTHRALAELKGTAATIPNETILIDTLALQEAKDSSAIENIITTEDDFFQGDAVLGQFPTAATKEMQRLLRPLGAGSIGMVNLGRRSRIASARQRCPAGFLRKAISLIPFPKLFISGASRPSESLPRRLRRW